MSVPLHPVLQDSPVENATLYEMKLHVHELLKRVDRLEKTQKILITDLAKMNEALKAQSQSIPASSPIPPAALPPPVLNIEPERKHDLSTPQGREQYLEFIKSPRGGWDAVSLEQIGIQWPPVKGWRQHYIRTGKPLLVSHFRKASEAFRTADFG